MLHLKCICNHIGHKCCFILPSNEERLTVYVQQCQNKNKHNYQLWFLYSGRIKTKLALALCLGELKRSYVNFIVHIIFSHLYLIFKQRTLN